MNMFTTAQLIGHNSSSIYYDTKTNQAKFSTIPAMTMLGNNTYDITLLDCKKQDKSQKTIKREKPNFNHHKRTRTAPESPDELRCCKNTLDGTRCSLKRCKQSGELCYIHYKKTLPKIEKETPVVEEKRKKWYHFW